MVFRGLPRTASAPPASTCTCRRWWTSRTPSSPRSSRSRCSTGSEPERLARDGDRLDLDLEPGQGQRRDLDDRVCRVRSREPLSTELDDLREVPNVRQVDRHLHDAVEPRPGGLEHPRQVAEDLLRLRVEVAHAHDVPVLVDGRLTGDDHEVADAEALREPEGLVRIRVEADLLDVRHACSSTSTTDIVGSAPTLRISSAPRGTSAVARYRSSASRLFQTATRRAREPS